MNTYIILSLTRTLTQKNEQPDKYTHIRAWMCAIAQQKKFFKNHVFSTRFHTKTYANICPFQLLNCLKKWPNSVCEKAKRQWKIFTVIFYLLANWNCNECFNFQLEFKFNTFSCDYTKLNWNVCSCSHTSTNSHTYIHFLVHRTVSFLKRISNAGNTMVSCISFSTTQSVRIENIHKIVNVKNKNIICQIRKTSKRNVDVVHLLCSVVKERWCDTVNKREKYCWF